MSQETVVLGCSVATRRPPSLGIGPPGPDGLQRSIPFDLGSPNREHGAQPPGLEGCRLPRLCPRWAKSNVGSSTRRCSTLTRSRICQGSGRRRSLKLNRAGRSCGSSGGDIQAAMTDEEGRHSAGDRGRRSVELAFAPGRPRRTGRSCGRLRPRAVALPSGAGCSSGTGGCAPPRLIFGRRRLAPSRLKHGPLARGGCVASAITRADRGTNPDALKPRHQASCPPREL